MPDQQAQATEAREAEPERYDRDFAHESPDSSWGKLLALVPENARVLDVGCAFGQFCAALKQLKACRVAGVELDPNMARKARERCDEFFEGDIASLLDDGSLPFGFDAIICADVLEHLLEPEKVAAGLVKLLKPGGSLFASIPNVTHLSVVLALADGRFPRSREGLLDSTHLRFYGEMDVLDLFHGVGCAARIVDRVRLDPRLTEFRSDLSALSEDVLNFLDRNPHGDTYQFIVRVVPRAWAKSEDDQIRPSAPSGDRPVTNLLVRELAETHGKLAEYHRALVERNAEAKELHERLSQYHSAAVAKDREIAETHAKLAEYNHALVERNAEAKELRERLSQRQSAAVAKDREIAETHAKLAEYDSALVERNAEAKELQERLSQHHSAVVAKDREIALLQKDLVEHGRQLTQARGAPVKTEAELSSERSVVAKAAAHAEDAGAAAKGKRAILRAAAREPLQTRDRERLRVLYVADRDDAPFRYRCVNGCEQLRQSGVVANITRLNDQALLERLAQYSVVVLFRLAWSERVADVGRAAREHGAVVAFDIDDLIFDASVEPLMPFLRRFPPAKVRQYRSEFAALQRTLAEVDVCIAATPTIARHARALGKDALVHPNVLSHTYVTLSRAIAPMRRVLLSKPLIGYMSGSDTHDGDLASVVEPLARLLDERQDASLVICGHSRVPPELSRFAGRILALPYQDYRTYPWLMARCNTLIAPIEQVNDFADAKSALKVFEAGVFGVPVVASPTVQYSEAIEHGVSGFLAESPAQWLEGLKQLCQADASLRMGEVARKIALREYSPDAVKDLLAHELLALGGRSQGRLPALEPLAGQDKPASLRQGIRRNAALARRSLALAFKPQLAGAQSSGTVAWGVETVGHDEALGVWLAAAVRDGERLLMDGKRVGLIVADRERPLGMHPAGGDVQSLEGPSSGCAFRATGPDPRFELPWPSDADGGRFLVLEMRARTDDGEGFAQLYWRERADDSFAEERSMRFSLLADGAMRVSIIDLRPAIDGGRWPKSIASVRFDPLDRAGEFEVAALALLDARPSRAVEARAMIAQRFLRGDGIEIGALQNPLQLPPQARVRYVDRLPLAELRRHYPELAGQELVDSSILASADRLTVVPEGTQDFVVCNHVLEHMRDPIGALLEWLRVLKPGGHLYVSIPDHQNPHDRLRQLTSLEHILADHQLRGQRAEEDRAHFFDWAHSAHAADMGPEQRESHARDLIAQDYSIQFHVFDRRLFEEVLGHVGGRAGSDVVELQENWLGEYREYIAIVRKTGRVEARARRPVDVVIPVYNARELTRRCLESVLRHAPADARVVVIDDASTTEGVAKDLQAFARRDQRVVVLSNPQNQGFVKTANRGLKNARGRDVLLLNSDTEVFEGFLDQLRDAAYTDERTGIVTPFSNNATIYSIPEFARDNEIPEGHSAASVAELVAAVSRKQRPQMPTAVGFCMFIRAEVLERVGFFDEETFGRGFGEENDLCQRARKAGFFVRLCDDAFVWHKGKASFGEGGKGLSDKNEALLRAKHPEYAALIADFCERNPLAPLHREIRFHLERLRPEARAAALFVVHADPFGPTAGGTEHHVRDLVSALALPRALIAYPRGSELVVAEVLGGKVEAPTFFRFPVAQPAERFCIEHAEVEGIFRNWLLAFGVGWAHLHHLMNWPIALGRVLRDAEVPYLFTMHDYYAVCPSWNLYDFEAKAVCECSWEGNACSAGCIPAMLLSIGAEPSADAALLRRRHRESFLDMLSGARAVVFPSEAARRATLQRLPLQGVRTEVVAHGYEAAAVPTAPRDPGGKLRLAVLGEISYQHKGAEAVLHLIELTHALPVEWHFLGDTRVLGYEQRLQALGLGERLHLHGRYRREEAAAKLGSLGADLCILLAQWDETFSYTLSEAAIAGVPAMVSDRGALGERVRRDGLGLVVKDAGEAAQRIAAFCEDPSQLEDLRARVRRFRHPDMADNALAYRALYDGIGLPALSSLSPPLRPELLHELSLRSGIASAPSDAVSHGGTTASPPARPRFPLLQRLKRIVPRTMWQLARDALAAIEQPALLRLNPARKGHGARLVGLRLLRSGLLSAIYEASGDDPQILFAPRPFAAAAVKEVRFKLRRDDTRSAYAQLFWCHPQDKGFSESKSARIALNTNAGEWGEYRLRLDDPNLRAKWEQGLEIVRLRFDPMNVPGRIEVGPLVLCS